MSKDKDPKNDQAEPAARAEPRAQTIPVKSLRFRPGFNLDIPGSTASSGITASLEPSTTSHHRVVFIPGLRCFRIEFYAGGGDLKRPPASIRHVHETWASWEPVS